MSEDQKPRTILTQTRVAIEDTRQDPAPLLSDAEKDQIRAEEFARACGGTPDQVSILHLEPETIDGMMEAGMAHAVAIAMVADRMKLPPHIRGDVAIVAIHHALVRVAESIIDPLDRINARRLGESMFQGLEQMRAAVLKEEGKNAN